MTLTLDIDLPDELARLRLPCAVAARLQTLLERQDAGQPLTPLERDEAEGLVSLAERFAERLRLPMLVGYFGSWASVLSFFICLFVFGKP